MSRHEIRLGRVFVMALHQAISEELPTRLEFYEHWLSPDRMRGGGLSLAPLAAVLGFLRTEGAGYGRVVDRAGSLTGEWAWQARPKWRRAVVLRLPVGWRIRTVARWATVVVGDTCANTHASIKVHKGMCDVEIAGSVFCTARDVPAEPLCGFYVALMRALFGSAQLLASGRMEFCRAGTDKTTRDREDKGVKCTGCVAVIESVGA